MIREAGVRIGISTHSHLELARALALKPDYVALGPIYPTVLKVMPWAPQGLERITEWKQRIGATPLAWPSGGLQTLERLPGVLAAGADSAAVVNDIVSNPDPEARTRRWQLAGDGRRGGRMTDRYTRQSILPEVGPAGQARLRAASVLVIGAGGLGSAVLQYLCAAGLGRLIIVDHDRVEVSNLHRQPIYRMSDVGSLKAEAARRLSRERILEVKIEPVCERLTPTNVARLVADADLVVDAADSFAVTYVVSDECQRVNKPLISASVLGLSGYVGAFCGGAPSYRAVFPEMPRQAGSCSTAGVLGTAVGVMGTLQAHMTLALLLDLQPGVLGQLVTVDFKTLRFGGFSFAGASEPAGAAIPFIATDQVAGKAPTWSSICAP